MDSSTRSLQAVFRHNGNQFSTSTVVHSVHLKGAYKTPRLLEKINFECYSWGVYGDFNDALSPSRFTRCIHVVLMFPLAVTRITSKENGQPENNDSRRTRSSCSSWQELAVTVSHNLELCETLCQSFASHVRCIAAYWVHVLSDLWSRNEEWNIYWNTNTTSATISRTWN